MSVKDKLGIQPAVREVLAPVVDNLPLPAIADLPAGAPAADIVVAVNTLFANLRAANLMEV